MINLSNSVNSREIPENKKQDKINDAVEKILNFNKQQKGKGLSILTPYQILQRLPIALAQVKAVYTPDNLLNKIKEIIYSFYRAKEITKKVCNKIINSIEF